MTSLTYLDSDGVQRELNNCTLTKDKAGRYWLWSKQLQHNLAYRSKDREDCFLSAISSLLFTLKLRDERIASLQRIANLAQDFAEAVNLHDNDYD